MERERESWLVVNVEQTELKFLPLFPPEIFFHSSTQNRLSGRPTYTRSIADDSNERGGERGPWRV